MTLQGFLKEIKEEKLEEKVGKTSDDVRASLTKGEFGGNE